VICESCKRTPDEVMRDNGNPGAPFVASQVAIGKRKVTWYLCVGCELAERRQQDGRAQRAIKVAERAGV
jgi:hypothetical protein